MSTRYYKDNHYLWKVETDAEGKEQLYVGPSLFHERFGSKNNTWYKTAYSLEQVNDNGMKEISENEVFCLMLQLQLGDACGNIVSHGK